MWLLPEEQDVVLNISLSPLLNMDKLVWRFYPTGVYSLKSGAWLATHPWRIVTEKMRSTSDSTQ